MWRQRSALLGVAILAFGVALVSFFPGHTAATTGINQEFSFEGKIVTTAGLNITDGSYNMEFDIYTGCTNEPTNNTGCSSVWSEDYLVGTNPVPFTSGTFQENLGQTTSLPTNIWNTYPLYLSIDIGNTSSPGGSCVGVTNFNANCGGQLMQPYILLTSTPYALNANQLGGIGASGFVQLSPGSAQSGNINIGTGTIASGLINSQTISSAAIFTGTVNIQGSSALTLGSGSNNGAVIFTSSGGSNTVTLQAPTTNPTASYALSLPTAAPSASGQCLQSSGSTPYTQLAFGSCSGGGSTLQSDYTASTGGTTPEIILDSTRDGLDIQDKTGDTIGTTQALLSVRGVGTASTLGASLFAVNASGQVAINNGSTSTTPTISFDLSLGQEATGTRTIGVEAQATTNNAGNGLTISAGAGNGSGSGGTLTLNGGGTAATAGSNGGGVQISGMNGTSTGTGGTGGNITLTAGNAGGTGANAGGNITLQAGSATSTGTAGNVSVLSDLNNTGVVTDSDTEVIQDTGASTNALTVNNNLGIPLVTVGSNNFLINGDFETAGTTNWSATGTGASIVPNSSPTYVYSGAGSLAITVGTTANVGAVDTTFNSALPSGTYVLSFYAKAGSSFTTLAATLGSGTCTLNSNTVSTSTWTQYSCVVTSSTPTEVAIESSGTTALTFYVDAIQLVSSTNLVSNPGFENGTTGWSATSSGSPSIAWNQVRGNVYHGQASLKVTTGSVANSGAQDSTYIVPGAQLAAGSYTLSFFAEGTTGFTTLQASLGTGTCTLNSNTVSTSGFQQYWCTVTTTAASPTIEIGSSGTTPVTFYLDDVQLVTGSSLLGYNLGQIQLRGIIDNPVLFQATSNSTLAFQIQNTSGTNLFAVDTLDTQINLGSAASTPVVLVLGNKNTSGDPSTCTVGAVYYNSNLNEFRACRYVASTSTNTWENLVAGVDEQKFTSNGTWTAPSGITTVMVVACGGGGSGGGGQTAASGAIRGGGSGGGGGARAELIMDATTAGSSQSVTVGAQVSGGNAGAAGTAGNGSSFGTLVIAKGGGAGSAGSSSSNVSGGGGGGWGLVGGNGSTTTVSGGDNATANAQGNGGAGGGSTSNAAGKPAEYGGGGGGGDVDTGATAGSAGGQSIWGGGGGGGGGGANASNAIVAGGAGGLSGGYSSGGGGTAGSGAIGGTGANATSAQCAAGGGGGGTTTTSTAYAGGPGGTGGGGGGGGGGGTTGGTGGTGGSGEVWVFSW